MYYRARLFEGGRGPPDTYSGGHYIKFGLILMALLHSSEMLGQSNDIFRIEFVVVYLFKILSGIAPKRLRIELGDSDISSGMSSLRRSSSSTASTARATCVAVCGTGA